MALQPYGGARQLANRAAYGAAAAIAFNQGMELAERLSGHVRRARDWVPDLPQGRVRRGPPAGMDRALSYLPPRQPYLPWFLARRRRRHRRRVY